MRIAGKCSVSNFRKKKTQMISFENHCFIAQSILTLTQKLRNSYIEIKQRSILIKMEKDVMGEKL